MPYSYKNLTFPSPVGGRRGRDRIVVGITTACTISAYHH